MDKGKMANKGKMMDTGLEDKMADMNLQERKK